MPVARKLARIAASSASYLAAFALVGGIASFVFDVLDAVPVRSISTALYYVLWCVLGIFCGLLSYDSGRRTASPQPPPDWTSREGAGKTGLMVILTEAILLAALFLPCYLVSGSVSLTLTYFIAIFASVVFGHFSLRPDKRGHTTASQTLRVAGSLRRPPRD
jgi:hypothetical protein